MSRKSVKAKHPIFIKRSIYQFYDRIERQGFDPSVLDLCREAEESSDDELMASVQAELNAKLEDVYSHLRRKGLDPGDVYKYTDMAFMYASLSKSHSYGVFERVCDLVFEVHGYVDYEPTGRCDPHTEFKLYMLHHWLMSEKVATWALNGKNIYVIDKNLSGMLFNTKLDGFPCDNIRLPHRSIFMAPPAGILDLALNNATTLEMLKVRGSSFDGVFIQEATHDSAVDGLQQVFTKGTEVDKPLGEGDRLLYITLMGVQGITTVSSAVPLTLRLNAGEHLSDARIFDRKDMSIFNKEGNDQLQKFIAGVLVYLTWSDADNILARDSKEYRDWISRMKRVPAPRAKKMKQCLDQVETTNTRYISLPVVDRHDKKESVNRGGSHASPVAHYRCGHFRSQPYGPKNKPKYKTIWIKPIMVGGKVIESSNSAPNVKVVR